MIGTDDRSDLIIVDEPHVSLRHCEVWRDGAGRILVQDLGSTNGTFLMLPNGKHPHRIWKAAVVTPNSTVWLGRDVALSWERLTSLLYGFDL